MLALLIAGAAFPTFSSERVQLAFSDEFELERNHFSEVWDRVGAWPPRRLHLDPFEPGTTRMYPLSSLISWSTDTVLLQSLPQYTV